MATANPFDLLGDDDNDDPSQLIAIQQQKIAPKKAAAPAQAQVQSAKPANMPSKPLPPAQAVREAKNEHGRGGSRGVGRGYGRGRGGGGSNRDSAGESSFGNSGFSGDQGAPEEPDSRRPSERQSGYGGPRGSFFGGRRGGFSNGETGDGERTHRVFEHRSGTGRGNEFKREGAGQGNWGTPTDEVAQVAEDVVNEGEKYLDAEKPSTEEDATNVSKENPANEAEEKKPEDKEMTLEEYEKVLEEKRKALQVLKTEERKVNVDKEFASMQQLSSKKGNEDIIVKLGSDKDKRKELAEKEDKSKKSVSINEFLKPAEGERYYNPRGGRGRGVGPRQSLGRGSTMSNLEAPKIEDPGQFPTLGAK